MNYPIVISNQGWYSSKILLRGNLLTTADDQMIENRSAQAKLSGLEELWVFISMYFEAMLKKPRSCGQNIKKTRNEYNLLALERHQLMLISLSNRSSAYSIVRITKSHLQ